ncbi:ComF family protein [Candidatus Fermentibacterales bacterium]|nr:ComF family protein [Candidatus Fermentibacterales bacterium]
MRRLRPNSWSHWSATGLPVRRGFPESGVAVHSAFAHEGAARDPIVRLKYDGLRWLAAPAAAMMLRGVAELPRRGDLILPLPLAPSRLRQRGFNQSELIAARVCRATGAKLSRALSRSDDRPPQVGLGAGARRANALGAYRCGELASHSGKIWLLDDVVTTGSTMDAASAAVRLLTGFLPHAGLTVTYRPPET